MRLKFLLIISAIYLTLVVGILTQGIQREKEREEYWIKENAQLQLHAINDNIGLEIDKMKAEALKVATAYEANQKEEAIKSLNLFAALGAVTSESETFTWKLESQSSGTSGADIWNGPWLQRAKEIPANETQPRFFAVQTHDDTLGSVIKSAVFFSAKIRDKVSNVKKVVRLVGVLNQPLFQTLLASQQGAGFQYLLFSQKGLAIAHTISDYVGNSLAGDRLFEDIRKNKTAMGNLSHKDFKGDAVVSMYEKIENTDLTLVAQLRPSQWQYIDWGYYGQTFLVVFGIFSLMSGSLFFILPRELGKEKEVIVEKIVEKVVEKIVEKPVDRFVDRFIDKPIEPIFEKVTWTKPVINDLATPVVQPGTKLETTSIPSIPVHIYEKMIRASKIEEIGATTEKAKLEVSRLDSNGRTALKMSILAKVISQIKAPFLSILGHVQIAKVNPQGGSLQAIENEARLAREVLDRLSQYSGLSQVPSITIPLIDLVDAALRTLEGPLLRGSIKVSKDIPENLNVKCDPDDMKLALSALFRNSIEAMEKVLKKELHIEAVRKNNSFFELSVSDSGEGILPRNIPALFEPFFTTKSPLEHRGLGLAAAQGIFSRHLGEIGITSDQQQGTFVRISLPVSIENPVSLASLQEKLRPAWMEHVKTPSHQEIIETESLLDPIEMKGPIEQRVPASTYPEAHIYKQVYKIEESEVEFELKSFEFEEDETDVIASGPLAPLAPKVDPGDKTRLKSGPSSSANVNSNSNEDLLVKPTSFGAETIQFKSVNETVLFASPTKRLKKKVEPLDSLKVQIPRPEEKL